MRKLRTMLLAWLLVAAVVLPLAAASPAEQELYASKHGVFYQIFVRSFADGDGDGLGDLRGSSSVWITSTTGIRKPQAIWALREFG